MKYSETFHCLRSAVRIVDTGLDSKLLARGNIPLQIHDGCVLQFIQTAYRDLYHKIDVETFDKLNMFTRDA